MTPNVALALSWANSVSDETIASSQTIYNDSVDVNYLKSITIDAQRDWVGVRILKKGDTCYEVKQDIKVDTKKEPFGKYVGASALPETVDVGKVKRSISVVDCAAYELAPQTINF